MNIDQISEWPSEIGGGYWFDQNGICFYRTVGVDKNGAVTDETSEPVANFTPILKEQRRIDNGIEVNEALIFQAYRAGHLWEEVSTDTKGIVGQTPQAVFGAGCRVYIGKLKVARLREIMQIQCETAPRTTIYQHTGYAIIDGKRVFLNGGYSVTAEGMTDHYNVVFEGQLSNYRFTNERHRERYKTLLQGLPAVAPFPLVYTGLGLAFLTPLNSLLRDEGIEPCFILYFTGKTGTRKTTMAKLLLNFFGAFDNGTAPPAGFRDTANAVEKKFALTDSTLILLDDRIPSTTQKVKAQMESMEQSVARQIGDRSGRARMNADGSLKATYRPKCNLIVTAEESFSNVGESAVARALSVELKPGDIDLDALTEVQANAVHLNECMGEYIQFVIQNWDSLKADLKPLFMELRSKAQTGAHGRLAECVAHLQIGITVMCKWLLSIGQINGKQAEEIKNRAWAVFMKLSEEQNRRIMEEKPVKLFIDAMREMIDRGAIRFVDISGDYSDYSSDKKMGYKDEDFYYCYPDTIYTAVRRFYSDQDKNFPLGKAAIFQQLAIDGLIEVDKAQTTKAKRIGNKRPRFLWLKASAIEREEETDNEHEGEE